MRLLPVVLMSAEVTAVAAPAYADANDDDFLAELRQAGITYQDPALAISAGKVVCQAVDQGKTAADIVTELRNRNSAFQGSGAIKFTTLSAAHYCPEYLTGEGRGPKPNGS